MGLILTLSTATPSGAAEDSGNMAISGQTINGLRILTDQDITSGSLRLYRGDYVVFPSAKDDSKLLNIEELKIQQSFPAPTGKKNYVKFKKAGTYEFSYGAKKGQVTVVEYQHGQYRAVRAKEAKEIIANIAPLLLDVRTKREYDTGHLANSTLIPVQIIQRVHPQLADYKDKPILIYCATGNRSTVTARILINNGFKNIYNMRYGLAEWKHHGLELVK